MRVRGVPAPRVTFIRVVETGSTSTSSGSANVTRLKRMVVSNRSIVQLGEAPGRRAAFFGKGTSTWPPRRWSRRSTSDVSASIQIRPRMPPVTL